MYLLPCPHCEASISVAPSHAGDETACPSCQGKVQIPRLRDLRLLPQAEETEAKKGEKENSGGGVAFGIFGLFGVACMLVASFCGIRWVSLEVPISTEQHLAELQEDFQKAKAAELIREFETLEKEHLDVTLPYVYHTKTQYRDKWGRNASIAGILGVVSIAMAFLMSAMRRKRALGPNS